MRFRDVQTRYPGTDKGEHGYLPYYEKHFEIEDIHHLLEIGVNSGDSLRMWRDNLHAGAQVVGIDIDPRSAERVVGEERITVITSDVLEVDFLTTYDVVVDDGSHDGREQFEAFKLLWPHVNPGGWYCIEDLETAWHEGFPGHAAIQELLFILMRDTLLGRTVTAFGYYQDIAELHVYEQIVFIRKR